MNRIAQWVGVTEGNLYTLVIGLTLGLVTVIVGMPPALRDRVDHIAQARSEVGRAPVTNSVTSADGQRPVQVATPAAQPFLEQPTWSSSSGETAVAHDGTAGEAAGPARQGWWWGSSAVSIGGTPPAPPDVPPDGLYVAGGLRGPQAYAAIEYNLAGGAHPSTLTLVLAPSSFNTPNANVLACVLRDSDAPFKPAQGGASSDAPGYDCQRSVKGVLTSGNAYAFDITGLIEDGRLAIAVVPGGETDRLVFSSADQKSLSER